MFYSSPLPYTTDAANCYAAIADLPWAVWLDSAGKGRYDILCAQPVATLITHGDRTEIIDDDGMRCSSDDPFALLRRQLGEPVAGMPDIPFAGGALGYCGYDLARRMMKLPEQAVQEGGGPDMAMGIYDWAIVFDHQQKSAQLVSQQRYAITRKQLPEILDRLCMAEKSPADTFRVQGDVCSNFTPDSYAAAFAQVKSYLLAGDCYQVNLAQRFSAAASGDALGAYLALRRLSPAPYSAFLNLPQTQILCASPERFLRVQNGSVETKPIKGTRPRSSDAQLDRQLAEELCKHPKDRAENLMIVDLLRNDLGKSCMAGSVRVPKLFEVESYANVHHLVSTVEGRLASGRHALDVLRDCFPGGSVTGAPKQRAMQIIEQLEPHRRGIYCGAIAYIGFDGNMDSNIVIRTLVYAENEIFCWAGGGIVADSEVDAEYQETLDKASAMLKLLQQYGGKYDCLAQGR
jgi:para-aminobenzoate synthetase component 1